MKEESIPEVKSECFREGRSLCLVFRESEAHSDRKLGLHRSLCREVLISRRARNPRQYNNIPRVDSRDGIYYEKRVGHTHDLIPCTVEVGMNRVEVAEEHADESFLQLDLVIRKRGPS